MKWRLGRQHLDKKLELPNVSSIPELQELLVTSIKWAPAGITNSQGLLRVFPLSKKKEKLQESGESVIMISYL